jgi:hypothetical protein
MYCSFIDIDRGSTFLQNVGQYLLDFTVLLPTRGQSAHTQMAGNTVLIPALKYQF